MLKKLIKSKAFLMLLAIFLISLFLRLYRIQATLTFLEDEARDALIVQKMVDDKRPVFLGPQTSTGNMYLGPLYYYLITPFLVISNFNPVGPAVFIAITGALTSVVLYVLGKKWFGTLTGVTAAALFALLPLPLSATRTSWNPNLVPLISVILLYVLDKTVTHPRKNYLKNFFLIGLLFGILIQLHYMALLLLPILGLILLFTYRKLLPKLGFSILSALAGFVLILSPFILFEFRHGFVNTNAIYRMVSPETRESIRYDLPLNMFKENISKTTSRLAGGLFGKGAFQKTDPYAGYLALGFFTITSIHLINMNSGEKRKKVLLIYSLVFGTLLLVGIYRESVYFHYLSYLFPLSYLLLASTLSNKKTLVPFLGFLSMVIVFAYSLPATYGYLTSGSRNQVEKAQDVATHIVSQAQGRKYNVIGKQGTQLTPFLYFLHLTDNPPTVDKESKLFVICENSPCTSSMIEDIWLFRKGPAHPSLTSYTGHPFIEDFQQKLDIINDVHVSNGVWVSEANY